jgi:DNA-binding LacI/PurR family transcriptional regulator
VSFSFTQPHRVRDKTRTAVLSAAAELGYVPSASARSLAKGRTGAIGFYSFDYFLEDGTGLAMGDPSWTFPVYVDEVQRGVELEVKRRGLALLLASGNVTTGLATVTDIAGRVDGLITFAETVPSEVMDRLSASIPVVEFTQEPRSTGVNTLTVDNAGGMHDLVDHMVRAHHVQRPVFVGSLSTGEMRARFAGYAEALRMARLPDAERLESASGDPQTTFEAASAFLDTRGLPDVFVCASDQIALALMQVLTARGVDIPADVAVTGFDGILAGRIATPQLTTVQQPMEQLGRRAVQIATESLSSTPPAIVHASLGVELAIRSSCGAH